MGTITSPILQVGRLRHREIRYLVPGQPVSSGDKIQIQAAYNSRVCPVNSFLCGECQAYTGGFYMILFP